MFLLLILLLFVETCLIVKIIFFTDQKKENPVKEIVEELERKKSDLTFLRSSEARIRREVYRELLDWIKEKWTL